MYNTLSHRCLIITMLVLFNLSLIPYQLLAQQTLSSYLIVPQRLAPLGLSESYQPVKLRGLMIDPTRANKISFLMELGDASLNKHEEQAMYQRLIKYFLAALTIPETDQWVNLSPYEKDQIIPDSFSQTIMGRDLLVQDYLLKQMSASLLHPDSATGKIFWQKVYTYAQQHLGHTAIPVGTLNKVWIVPDKAEIYEQENKALIVHNSLKVMMQDDYLALSHQEPLKGHTPQPMKEQVEVVKSIIIPVLEKEVNEGRHFAVLRQIYSAMILATWFKQSLNENVISIVYANQAKVKGLEFNDTVIARGVKNKSHQEEIGQIYQQYITAYKQGVFNFVRENDDPLSQYQGPVKYFAGGMQGYKGIANQAMISWGGMIRVIKKIPQAIIKELNRLSIVEVFFDERTIQIDLEDLNGVDDPSWRARLVLRPEMIGDEIQINEWLLDLVEYLRQSSIDLELSPKFRDIWEHLEVMYSDNFKYQRGIMPRFIIDDDLAYGRRYPQAGYSYFPRILMEHFENDESYYKAQALTFLNVHTMDDLEVVDQFMQAAIAYLKDSEADDEIKQRIYLSLRWIGLHYPDSIQELLPSMAVDAQRIFKAQNGKDYVYLPIYLYHAKLLDVMKVYEQGSDHDRAKEMMKALWQLLQQRDVYSIKGTYWQQVMINLKRATTAYQFKLKSADQVFVQSGDVVAYEGALYVVTPVNNELMLQNPFVGNIPLPEDQSYTFYRFTDYAMASSDRPTGPSWRMGSLVLAATVLGVSLAWRPSTSSYRGSFDPLLWAKNEYTKWKVTWESVSSFDRIFVNKLSIMSQEELDSILSKNNNRQHIIERLTGVLKNAQLEQVDRLLAESLLIKILGENQYRQLLKEVVAGLSSNDPLLPLLINRIQESGNPAMNSLPSQVGGIDFNAKYLDLTIRTKDKTKGMLLSQEEMARLRLIQALNFTVIDSKPIKVENFLSR